MIIPETFAEGERRVTAIGEGRPGVIHLESNTTGNPAAGLETAEFDARVEANQRRLAAEIRPSYDFIVCGSGSSGSVVAGRLAESRHASVLLLEAGGTDDVPTVREAQQSLANLRSERDWAFQAVPNPLLNGRRLLFSMGKVLGGGSSINAMVWSRGHKDDWDYFAEEAADPGWNYESVLGIYRRIEDWQGTPDPLRRGKGGLVYVEPAHDPNPIAPAMLDAARSLGIPTFDDQNGEMMEGEGGAAIANVRIRDSRRLSVFRTYAYPNMGRHNLTVLTGALVARVVFGGKRAVGVEFLRDGQSHRIAARCEIVLSLGAINTPKVLMQSGIGNRSELTRAGIDVVQHLPGVGRNFQDHILTGCVWVRGRMLAVGDAAFAHNPLAGRGLSFALGSALAAAATVASWRNRPRACADAAEYYREYVDAERRRHLAFLASFDNRPPPIRPIGSSHVLSWQAPVAMTPLALGECIRRAPAIRLNDGGFVRWLGDFDLLQLRALCAVSARPDALIARLCALGLGGREAVLLLHWAVQNGVLAETEAERGGRLASPI